MKLQESSGVSFSLSFLLQILGVIVVGVWGFSQLDARIATLSQSSATHTESINRIERTLEKNRDVPISSDHVQNTKLSFLEAEHAEVLKRLAVIDDRLYDLRMSTK